MNQNIQNAILASLVADAYNLGSHWVYDEKQLQELSLDWNTLNAPEAMWHKGKEKGDFTHYGDQTFYLLEYMKENRTFNKEDFYLFWKEKMSVYTGYIDGATRGALENIGHTSNDLSICGRLAPLLINVDSKEVFLQRVKELVEITHNTQLAHDSSQFFGKLLWASLEKEDIQKSIQILKTEHPELEAWINAGTASKQEETFKTIREFGPACGIDGGFSGVIHLLSLDDDFKTVLEKNARAGGDNSARGMVVAMILGSQDSLSIPNDWVEDIKQIKKIKQVLKMGS
jgi:ADP-ribosylglycohydrolase